MSYQGKVKESNLMLVMGTSLKVAPVSILPVFAKRYGIPRVLVNNEEVGDFADIKEERYQKDATCIGQCDDEVKILCKELGWLPELENLHSQLSVDAEVPKPVLPKFTDLRMVALSNSLIVPTARTFDCQGYTAMLALVTEF